MPRRFVSCLRLFISPCLIVPMLLPGAAVYDPSVALAQSTPPP